MKLLFKNFLCKQSNARNKMKSIFPLTLAAAASTLLITSLPLHAKGQSTSVNSSRSNTNNNLTNGPAPTLTPPKVQAAASKGFIKATAKMNSIKEAPTPTPTTPKVEAAAAKGFIKATAKVYLAPTTGDTGNTSSGTIKNSSTIDTNSAPNEIERTLEPKKPTPTRPKPPIPAMDSIHINELEELTGAPVQAEEVVKGHGALDFKKGVNLSRSNITNNDGTHLTGPHVVNATGLSNNVYIGPQDQSTTVNTSRSNIKNNAAKNTNNVVNLPR